jgi:hypothetical protein
MTDDERRESAINYKASLYIAEIREMADKARAEFTQPKEVEPVFEQAELMRIYNALRNAAQQDRLFGMPNYLSQQANSTNPLGLGYPWR